MSFTRAMDVKVGDTLHALLGAAAEETAIYTVQGQTVMTVS